jgi:replicative DNA helicase
MASVPAIVQAVKKLGNVGMVIIDYLQLLAAARKRNNRVEEMSEITRSLKLAARELRVPFLVLSQLSRESAKEDRKPQLHDLRDSGSIEQDADIVAFLYSPANEIREAIAQRRASELELIVAKNRNGPQGTVKLRFSARTMQMIEATT